MAVSIGMLIPPKLRELGVEAVARWASSAGLTALDLPEAFAAWAAACRAQGLQVGAVQGTGQARLLSRDAQKREAAVASLLDQVRAMPAAGASRLFLCLVPEEACQPIAESLAIFRETFPAIAAVCEAAEVRVVFEGWPGPAPHFPTLGCTPEVLRAMFAAVPSRALGFNYDPSHLVRLGIDYRRVLAEFGDRIYHVHGKDTALLPEAQYLYGRLPPALDRPPSFGGGAWRYCVPGDGVVDWGAVAFELHAAGYAGCVSIELEDARYWGTLEKEQAGIARAYQHLARYWV
jgi:sugar phosphate isomerase/epimerase